jgi:hypothetical protein
MFSVAYAPMALGTSAMWALVLLSGTGLLICLPSVQVTWRRALVAVTGLVLVAIYLLPPTMFGVLYYYFDWTWLEWVCFC